MIEQFVLTDSHDTFTREGDRIVKKFKFEFQEGLGNTLNVRVTKLTNVGNQIITNPHSEDGRFPINTPNEISSMLYWLKCYTSTEKYFQDLLELRRKY